MTQTNNTDSTAGLSGSGLRVGQLPGEVPADAAAAPAVPHHADGLLNRRWAQNVLPFATSLLFHLTVIGVGFGLYKTVQAIQSPNKEQQVVPSMTMTKPATLPKLTPNSNPMADPFSILKDPAREGSLNGNESEILAHLPGPTGKEGPVTSFIGRQANSSRGGTGFGGPGGDRMGTPGGTGTNKLGGGYGPFGGSNAKRIVYLCDCSGSMLGVFGDVKAELKKSVNSLVFEKGVYQQFNVIFFSDGQPQMLFKDGVQFATPANKKLAMPFIDDAVASGGTTPLPAIKAAVGGSTRPDLVFVLTDGFDNVASFDDVVDTFKRGTADGGTHVNCVYFEADPDPKLVEVLNTIAKNGHGLVKTILKSDMQ